jgi:hypothetical protein
MRVCGDRRLPTRSKAILGGLLSLPSLTRSVVVTLMILSVLWLTVVQAQDATPGEEIPIQRCDGLPIIKVGINGTDMFFLLDTASTTILNLKSFPSGRSKRVPVTTWAGNTTANGREIFLPEVTVGDHRLRDLTLPAVDLSTVFSPLVVHCGFGRFSYSDSDSAALWRFNRGTRWSPAACTVSSGTRAIWACWSTRWTGAWRFAPESTS